MKAHTYPKPTGAWEVRRNIQLPSLTTDEAVKAAVEERLGRLPGMRSASVEVSRQRISVLYDLTETDYGTLVAELERAGFTTPHHWWFRLKANWYAFTDSNARENAKAPPPACCNKPPR